TDNSWGDQGNYSIRFADYVNGCNSLRDSTKEYLYGPDGGVCLKQNIQTNRWYFVVFTTDGTTCRTYINNKLSHIGAHPQGLTFTNQHDLRFGMFGDSISYPYYFKGIMDDIRIYNRSLDADEVGLLYNDSPFPSINGNVYVDVNNNGIMDSTDYYKPNVKIIGSNGTFAITNLQGNYDIVADSLGNFSDSIVIPNLFAANTVSHSYNFNTYDTTVEENYILQNTTQLFDSLSIRIIPLFNAARPGFDYPVGVTYANEGNTFLNNLVLTIPYDSSKLLYVSSTNNSLVDNGTSLSIPASNLASGQHTSFMISFKVKNYASLGDTLKLIATVATNTIASIDSSTMIISGSYDPNDKDATPQLTTADVAQGKYIDYIIRFENTGTDTAFKVIVTDELSNFLDYNTLQLTSLSHPCNIQVKDNKVSFVFNDIKLPHNAIDKIACYGYISFRVKPNLIAVNGTNILNTASIYFDYNLPIVTNTAVTKIKDPVVTPLKFISYDLKIANNSAENKIAVANFWKTSNELNVHHFNVQRSFNGRDFTSIGEVVALNKINNDYSFIDLVANSNTTPAIIYYRIEAIDKDGSKTNSNTRTINTKQQTVNIQVYPNPATNQIIVQRKTDKTETVSVVDI
ncbi:MAG: LamG domain-containing protein, partial [Bacteroidetes bacterium]|nr:LamG domain-containing protein [Bacteroidota bacterium]